MSSPKMSATIGWSSSDSAVGVKNVKVVQQKSVCIIPSGVTISKKSVSIEYEYPTIEFEQMSTTIQFLKVEVEYYSQIFVEY